MGQGGARARHRLSSLEPPPQGTAAQPLHIHTQNDKAIRRAWAPVQATSAQLAFVLMELCRRYLCGCGAVLGAGAAGAGASTDTGLG